MPVDRHGRSTDTEHTDEISLLTWESNPRPTHYEKPGPLLWGRYLHRSQHTRPGMHSAHSVFQILGHGPGHSPASLLVTERH
jgi:hypothetical protein